MPPPEPGPPAGSRLDGAVPFRARGFAPRERPLAGAATLIGLLLAWEGAARAGWISTDFLSTPLAIGHALAVLIASGQLTLNLLASLQRLAVGWGAGTVAGLAVGLAIGLYSPLRSPLMALVSAFFPVPKIALVPLFIIWFGIGEGSKDITVGFGVFFPTVIAVVSGVDAVPRNLIRMAQSFGLSHAAIVRKVVLPSALPSILAGFRITTSTAIILLVAAEMIGAQHGLGAYVLETGNLYDIPDLMAGIVTLAAIGLFAAFLIGRLERTLLRWR